MADALMKIGPKGQIVIPKLLRDDLGFAIGEEVLVGKGDEGAVIKKKIEDPIAVFRRVALSKPRVDFEKIDKQAYESEIEERWEKIKRK